MPAAKPRVREDLAVVEIDGEAVVYDERTNDIHHLNPTAAIVFSLCDGSATVKEFSADIASAFNAPLDEVDRQVRALVREFRKNGLFEERAGTKPSSGRPKVADDADHRRDGQERERSIR